MACGKTEEKQTIFFLILFSIKKTIASTTIINVSICESTNFCIFSVGFLLLLSLDNCLNTSRVRSKYVVYYFYVLELSSFSCGFKKNWGGGGGKIKSKIGSV